MTNPTLLNPERPAKEGRKVHLSGYQNRDREVIDYQMYELDGTGLCFRGPEPTNRGRPRVAFIGAAQTFGCFCERPFPAILGEQLDVDVLNLGYGGAGPEFFLGQERLLEVVNECDLVVLQAMSGRSQSNSLFDSGGLEYLTRRSDGRRFGANDAYRSVLEGPAGFSKLGALGKKAARVVGRQRAKSLVEETRAAWVRSNVELMERIKKPVVFFWFSKRQPKYDSSLKTVHSLFGEFPQLVNGGMVDEVARESRVKVECVTERGSPQPLFSRHTGKPTTVDPADDRPDLGGQPAWSENLYYPSPEMHEDAAAALVGTMRELL